MSTPGVCYGSRTDSARYKVFKKMGDLAAPVSSQAIIDSFDPKEGVTRLSVCSALNQLIKFDIVKKSGGHNNMVYELTGKPLPIVGIKPVKTQEYKPPKPEAPMRQPNRQTINIYRFEAGRSLPSPAAEKHFRAEAPVRINCNSCEWWGPEPKCEFCKYELPHKGIAA